jgi:type III secretory pathway component EscU
MTNCAAVALILVAMVVLYVIFKVHEAGAIVNQVINNVFSEDEYKKQMRVLEDMKREEIEEDEHGR